MLHHLRRFWNSLLGSSPVRVMVVDDSAFIRLVVMHQLRKRDDLEVVAGAANAMEARNLLAEIEVDAILLDLEMPRGGGLQLLERLPPIHRRRCLLFTALPPKHPDVVRGMQLGAAGCVHKSSRPEDIPELVESLTNQILKIGGRHQMLQRRAAPTRRLSFS